MNELPALIRTTIQGSQPTLDPVVVGGTQSVVSTPARASEVYLGLKAQREVLEEQLRTLERSRRDLVRQLEAGPQSEADAAGLTSRLAQVDQRIASVSLQIGESDAQLAISAGVPGAVVEPPRENPWEYGPPDELVAMAIGFSMLLLMPLAIAWARRVWRKSSVVITLPPELTERMASLERSVDAVAVEVERIGEGQRFVTQLLADRRESAGRVIAAPADAGGPGSA